MNKILTRPQFDQLSQMDRATFIKAGGKLVETPGKPTPDMQHEEMNNFTKTMTKAAYERIPVEHRAAYLMNGWKVA